MRLDKFEEVIIADKKGKTTKNAGRWTQNEIELFAKVLADLEKTFAISLEKLALKKSAKMKYSSISKILLRWKWITKLSSRIILTTLKAMLQN